MATVKKIIIPVGFETDLSQLEKIGDQIKKIGISSSAGLSEGLKSRATELSTLLTKTITEYNAQIASGAMTQEMEAKFIKTFSSIDKEFIKLGKDARKEIKNLDIESLVPASIKEQFLELKDNISISGEKLKELKSIDFANLKELFSEEERAFLNIDRFTNYNAALNELNRQTEKLNTLEEEANKAGGIENLSAKKQEQLQALRETNAAREIGINVIKQQTSFISENQLAIKNEQSQLESYVKSLDNLTEEQKKIILGGVDKTISTIPSNKKDQSSFGTTNTDRLNKQINDLTKELNLFSNISNAAKSSAVGFLQGLVSGQLIITAFKRILSDSIRTIQDLDKAFNEIAMVSTYTTNEVWKMKDAFTQIALSTGLSIVKVTELAGEFFKQGGSYRDVLKLTEAAAIAANIAGISASESVDYLTSAIRGYQLSADQAMMVSDKFAALAAESATDYEELAIALSKVAAQAYSVGVNMDNMMGFIAKALETTREAPENIGTAFKTIFARMSELKDFGKTLDDGIDVNRVETALQSIGVELTDTAGEFRNLDDVLIDTGKKWSSLSKNQKAYIATALAGTRQQTRLISVFEDFDRTMELVEISSNSLGASFAQQNKYTSSIAFAQNKLTVAWQQLLSSLSSSDAFIAFYNILASTVTVLNKSILAIEGVVDAFGGLGFILSALTIAYIAINSATIARSISLGFEHSALILGTSLEAGKTAATKLSTAAIWENIGAIAAWLLTNPVGWLLLATAAFVAIAASVETATEKNNKYVESMRKTQAEIYNYRKKADDMQGLIDRYEELNNKINLTSEDIKEQTSIAQQLQDLAGEDVNLFNFEGELDLDKATKAIEDLKNKSETSFKDLLKTTLDTYKDLQSAYNQTTDQTTREALIIQKAIENQLVNGRQMTYDEFLKLEKNKREDLKKTAELELNMIRDATVATSIAGYSENMDKASIDKGIEAEKKFWMEKGVKAEEAYRKALENAAAQGFVTLNYEVKLNEEDIKFASEQLQKLLSADFENLTISEQSVLLNNYGFNTWTDGVKEAIGKVIPDVQSLDNLMVRLNTDSQGLANILSGTNFTADEIYNLNDAITELNLGTELEGELLKTLLKSGTNTFGSIIDFTEKENLGLFTTVDIIQKISDALDSVSIQSLGNEITSIRSLNNNLLKVNEMISGASEYDLAFMDEMVRTYPQIATAIRDNRELSISEMETIASFGKAQFKDHIQDEIDSLNVELSNNQIKIDAYKEMLLHESDLNTILANDTIDINQATLEQLETAWETYQGNRVKENLTANDKIRLDNLKAQYEKGDIDSTSYNSAVAAINQNLADNVSVTNEVTSVTSNFENILNDAISGLEKTNQSIKDQITNLTFLKTNIDRVTAATNAGTAAAEAYKAALDEIVLLGTQIDAVGEQLDMYKAMEDNAKAGKDWVAAIYSQNAAYKAQNDLLNKNIQAQKNQQNAILDSLGSLKGVVKIINGRMVVSMQDYINKSEEEQKIIDDSVESYNDLSSSINDNTQTIYDNTNAIDENLQKIEDKTVELYDTIAEAVKNSEEKKLKELQDSWSVEKELLDKRKAAYEKAFSEEDYNQSLEDLSKEREDIIKQLSNLEGATDLASTKKKQELLDKKAELDKQYNKNVTDYNREALLKSIDDQSTAIDNTQSEYEKAYEERINSVEWLENQVTTIINQGLDATINYLKQNLPEYENAWSISKDNIVDGWTLLYDQVTTTVEAIENNIPDFSGMIEQLRQAVSYVGSLQTLGNNGNVGNNDDNKDDNDKNSFVKSKEWHFMNKGYGQSEADANKARNAYLKPYFDAKDEALKNSSNMSLKPNVRAYWAQEYDDRLAALQTAAANKVSYYKTGGIADFTGPAWLDGTKSKPERILSPMQTELFDRMVHNLEVNRSNSNNLNSSISIDNISIQTPQLNTNTDFKSAGRDLANEILTAISERGLAINKKR